MPPAPELARPTGRAELPPKGTHAAPLDPAALNGDLPLNRAQVAAYLAFHARRNARGVERSHHIATVPGPWRSVPFSVRTTPSRIGAAMFFEMAAERALSRFGGRPITILDIGCGSGNVLEPFAARGMRGTYLGVDIARHAKWSDAPLGGFDRRLIVRDVNTLGPEDLPMGDVVASCTALEHIRDDAGATRLLLSRTAPGGMHAHAVPAEAALALYGTHGWRQYCPADLATLFPGGTIYRYGGPLAHAWHAAAVVARSGQKPLRERTPGVYSMVRELAMSVDRECGERMATLYGVVWEG